WGLRGNVDAVARSGEQAHPQRGERRDPAVQAGREGSEEVAAGPRGYGRKSVGCSSEGRYFRATSLTASEKSPLMIQRKKPGSSRLMSLSVRPRFFPKL